MNSFSLTVEILVSLMMLALLAMSWRIGRQVGLGRERGWAFIFGGFTLLFLGSLIDITDHFPSLSWLLILGQTPYQTIAEKLVAFLGGFTLLAIGWWLWLPHLAARYRAEEALRRNAEELELHVQQRTSELQEKTLRLQLEIEERRATEEQLKLSKEAAEDANRTKSQFLANMSHELRTPLNAVIGFANILHKNKKNLLGAQEIRYLDRVRANGEHLLRLINEVLDLERIESGRIEVNVGSVDLNGLIAETVAEVQEQHQRSEVDLRAELPQLTIQVQTDGLKLKQVLSKLVNNALKFTERGQVRIRLELDSTQRPRRIDVEDTGIGIPNDRVQKIFDAFQQVDASKSRRYGGTGLGLSVAQSLCRLLGYQLAVKSAEGKGSTFSIHLHAEPLNAEASCSETIEHAPRPMTKRPTLSDQISEALVESIEGAGGHRILVVDDSIDSRLLLFEILTEMGCRPICAASGEEALILAGSERPDLITLDLMMPDMDGWEILAALKNDPDLARIPVVVVSIVAVEERGTVLGAVDALSKPVSRSELSRVLRRSLPGHAADILVIDDEEDQRLILREQLTGLGFRVHTANNGQDALQQLERLRPDLILVDLCMPLMDGPSFLEALRRIPHFRHVPVAVITAKDLSTAEIDSLQTQVSKILPKSQTLEIELQRFLNGLAFSKEA